MEHSLGVSPAQIEWHLVARLGGEEAHWKWVPHFTQDEPSGQHPTAGEVPQHTCACRGSVRTTPTGGPGRPKGPVEQAASPKERGRGNLRNGEELPFQKMTCREEARQEKEIFIHGN